MNSFDIEVLILPFFSIFLLGFIICYYVTRNILHSLFVAIFKSFFFLIYFGYFFDGFYTFKDDWTYLREGLRVIGEGYTFIDLLINHDQLMSIFFNNHFVYQMYNVLSVSLFGPYYFSPVALNTILTFITAFILSKTLISIGYKESISKLSFLFFVLHWDILTWGAMVNLKDILVQLLTVGIFYFLSLSAVGKNKYIGFLFAAGILLILTYLRFYLPVFIVSAYFLFRMIMMISRVHSKSYRSSMYVILMAVVIVIFQAIIISFENHFSRYMVDFVNPVIGIPRLLLTPIPFHIDENYQFIFFSSFLHWLTFPFALLGMYLSFKTNNKYFLMLFVYFSILVLFYGTYAELQGPRHRVQITFIFALYQFLGLLYVVRNIPIRKLVLNKVMLRPLVKG